MRSILYLDIDDTLIVPDGAQVDRLRPGAVEIVSWAKARLEPRFLTCWSAEEISRELRPVFAEAGMSIEGIPVARWDRLKTDAIDFTRPFWWLDDHVEPEEWKVLEARGAENRVIVVDPEDEMGLVRAFVELVERMKRTFCS